MFFIWGTGTSKKALQVFVNDMCGVCNHQNQMQVFKVYSYFSLFFIPFIRWGTKFFIVCPTCGAGKQLSKAEFEQIKAGRALNPAEIHPSHTVHPQVSQAAHIASEQAAINVPQAHDKLEKQVFIDINNSIGNAKELDDDRQFNLFYAKLKNNLVAKYHDEDLVNRCMKKYFNL